MTSPSLHRLPVALAIGAAVLLTVASCTAPPGRGGATVDTISMRSLYGNGPGGLGADALRALLDDPRSPAPLTDVTDELTVNDSTDSDGDAIAALRAGDADIAVVRAGRLGKAGATSLLALQAPMVVTNDEQAARIAADRTIRSATLSGLRRIGLVGLALVPGGVRHPIGYTTALARAQDFRGAIINTRPDATAEAIMTALGATVDHSVGTHRTDAVRSGHLRGIELSMGQQGAADKPAVLASNVPLYAKYDVLVVRAKVFDALSEAQRTALTDRAVADAATAVAARDSESAGLGYWCGSEGASSIVVTDAVIAGYRAALDPVVRRLRARPGDAAVIDRMAALHDGTADSVGRTCTAKPTKQDEAFTLAPKGDQTVLDGMWRIEVSADDMVAAGAPSQDAYVNSGVWTFDIRNGLAQVAQPHGKPCTMRFTFAGTAVLLDQAANGNASCGGMVRGTYRLDGDDVRFDWTAERDYPVELDRVTIGSLHRVGA